MYTKFRAFVKSKVEQLFGVGWSSKQISLKILHPSRLKSKNVLICLPIPCYKAGRYLIPSLQNILQNVLFFFRNLLQGMFLKNGNTTSTPAEKKNNLLCFLRFFCQDKMILKWFFSSSLIQFFCYKSCLEQDANLNFFKPS